MSGPRFREITAHALLVALSALLSTGDLRAGVRLAKMFGDNAVLQCEMPLPVWGWADPGETVTVEFAGQTVSTAADGQSGRWRVTLAPVAAGGPYELKARGSSTVTAVNVLAGEVWFCAGQSNMDLELKNCTNAAAEIAAAKYPQIRFLFISRVLANEPVEDISTWNGWVECSPSTAGGYTGVGYFMARNLHQTLGRPVGIIQATYGGTRAETWTPRETLAGNPVLAPILVDWPEMEKDVDWMYQDYLAYLVKVEAAKAAGQPIPVYYNAPTALYNGMVAPVMPFAIRGAAWYQGEGNDARIQAYRTLFPAMIRGWRQNWGQGDFPFLFVQLPNYEWGASWPDLREAQSLALDLPNTGMAVTIDVGESQDIHPKNKQDVGLRMALIARSMVYGEQNLIGSGPVFESMTVSDGRCRISFTHRGDGLVMKGLGPLRTFEIAGKDSVFAAARAEISGDMVVVWNDQIPDPVFVRYAWSNNPQGPNLYNLNGKSVWLPAGPFRTDRAVPGTPLGMYDFNQDWKLSLGDALGLLLRMRANPSDPACDCNRDGQVNLRDVAAVLLALIDR